MTKLKSCQKLGKKTSKPNKMSKFQKDWLNSKINGSMLVRHFTLLDIKKLLLNKFPEIITISLPTLLRVLRKDLSLSFKKATKLKTKMDTHEKKVWFVRWAALLANLLEETRDILFIDEFKISPLKRDYNTWSQKGKPACLWTYKSSFEISAIVGFNLEGWIYFFATNGTTNSAIFQWFIVKVILSEQKLSSEEKKVWQVADNASIHKTKEMWELIIKYSTALLAIAAYSPSLNPAESWFCE